MKRIVAIFLCTLMLVTMGASAQEPVVKVGSKDFTEQLILGQLALIALENNGIPVEDKTNVAGSDTCRKALEAGEFGMYWEYTGTAWVVLLGEAELIPDSQQTYEKVRDADLANGITWLNWAPLNNTYALVMPEALVAETGITSYSELGAYLKANPGKLVLAADHEFTVRPDGLPGLVEMYGTDFGADIVTMDMGIVFQALKNNQAQVGMVFATDSRIKANNLTLLKDDKNFFPIYNAAPSVRTDILEAYPQIADILNPISEKLTDDVMIGLNYLVDIDGEEPYDVAKAWLLDEGFIK